MNKAFNPKIASHAIVDGLKYLQNRMGWSGRKIANILHLPPSTINAWLKKGAVPLHDCNLRPEIQAIVHLLAIHRSLESMFENPIHQGAWLTTIHPELGMAPEKIMGESMEKLIFIRQYLDSA